MFNRLGRSVVVLLVVGSLLLGASAAFATDQAITDRATTDRVVTDRRTDAVVDRPVGRFGHWVIVNTMEILGVNRGQIVSTLAAGGTLADLAEEQGSSGEALAEALVAIAQARVDEAVAGGKATEEQAAAFMERITAAIQKAVFEPHHPSDRVRDRVRDRVHRHFEGIRRLLWKTTIEYLDVNRGDIVSTFAKGETLADLAVEQGSSGGALVDELVTTVDARLTEAVADGAISEEQKAEMLADASEAIARFVFTPHHPGRGNAAS